MKPSVLLLAMCVAPAAVAQMANGPAPAPSPSQNVQMQSDGRCTDARPGDIVHYSLTIDAVGAAKAVYAELQLREGRGTPLPVGLPAPDFRNLAGGGLGVREGDRSNVFHFSFRVPEGLVGGVYRGIAVVVTVDRPVGSSENAGTAGVTRKAREEVHAYCLNLMSGAWNNDHPEVTGFHPGPVERPTSPAPR